MSIAGKLPETGYSGGFFNSSAVVKSIPFDRHSALQGISPHKGARTFVIHGDRFLPHIRSISDSVIVRDRRKCSLQRERLSAGEWRREQTQVVKNLLQDPPHRQEYGYYMQGHVCPLQSKDKMATHTQDEPILPKTDLFFGRGIRYGRSITSASHTHGFHAHCHMTCTLSHDMHVSHDMHASHDMQVSVCAYLQSIAHTHRARNSCLPSAIFQTNHEYG